MSDSKKNGELSEAAQWMGAFIKLCDDLAWGRPADEDALFALTRDGAASAPVVRLAEAFGMMIVKVEAREFHRAQLIEDLRRRNAELEAARAELTERNHHLSTALQKQYSTRSIIGQCPAMRAVVELAMSIARRPINTLILGPTGTGKEVIAKAIHFNSPRRSGPFIAVNCTAIADSLFESEMFGIEKGIATGVVARKGLIEEADGGTLFLDELGDVTLANQAKLLRVLEEREVLRVGSSRPVSVDINVVTATNANLFEAVHSGRFREDLYYRVNVAEITLPPLRERGEDVLLLARHFLEQHCARMGRQHLVLLPETRRCLMAYAWPGNVRELNNEMERAAALAVGNEVSAVDLSPRLLEALPPEMPLAMSPVMPVAFEELIFPPSLTFNLAEAENLLIDRVLTSCDGNKSRAAELLGITREGLRKKMLRRVSRETEIGAVIPTGDEA